MTPPLPPAALPLLSFALLAPGCLAGGTASITATPSAPLAPPALPPTPAWERFNADSAAAVGFPQHPSISPDGRTIVFAWAGDLWCVPSSGGAASRLTAHPATESASAFSPDGSLLAFESDRDGARNLYIMPVLPAPSDGYLIGGAPRRITVSDRAQSLGGFSADGSELLFSSSQEPSIYRSTRMYRVPIDPALPPGAPTSRITDAFGATPRASHDGETIVFTRGRPDFTRPAYRGSGDQDVFTLHLPSSTFTQLTTFDGTDGDAFPLPDGSVVFISSRDGQNNLWKLAPGATDESPSNLTQLTFFQPAAPATEDGTASIGHGVRDLYVSHSGQWAVFAVWDTLYRLDLTEDSPQPHPVPLFATGDAADLDYERTNLARQISEAALSPDGKTLAVIARGEVFIRATDEGRPTRRVTYTAGRERDLAWSPDGRVLYFASDETGDYSIYQATVALTRDDLKPPADSPASPSKPKTDPAPADPNPVDPPPPAEPPGTPDPNPQQPPTPETSASAPPPPEPNPEPAAAPESGSADDPAPADKPGEARKKDKAPDHGKRWQESLRYTIEPLIDTPADERYPVPSPDGTKLLFVRGLGDLILYDLVTGEERTLFTGWNEPDVSWAGDSRHIVFARQDLDFNSDIFLLDTADADARPINLTRHPDMDVSPRLSADGKVLVFLSDRAGENGDYDVYALNLDERLDGLPDYELAQHYKDAAAAAKKRKPLAPDAKPVAPYTFDTENAYLRVRRLTSIPGRQSNLQITPAADRIAFTADIDGRRTFVSIDHKGGDRKTLDASAVGNVTASLTGDKFLYIKSGQAYTVPPTGGKVESLPIDAPVTIDIAAQQRQKFLETARTIGARFYHPTLKGLDWSGLTQRYLSLAMKTRTADEFNRVVGLLFGELDGSHLGISGGARSGRAGATDGPIGHLGIDAEPAVADGAPGYRITRIIPGGPAHQRWSRLEVGETIVAIDGRPLGEPGHAGPGIDLAAALAGKAGQETLLELVRADGRGRRFALITPISSAANSAIRYEDEIAQRRALVDRLSNGRLGYLHIRGMSMTYVRDFERDLFAAGEGKEGLIIDVRDNGGGSTADILLASLTAPRHATTIPRGADPATVPPDAYPRDRRLIYAWTRPISVLINENSFSNAEIFAHAIKNTGRGTLVGTPTYGGVISTGAFTLIDGASVRLPFRGWYLPDGRDMENNGAQPDLPIPQTPAAEAAGEDPQLEAAVRELLGRLE